MTSTNIDYVDTYFELPTLTKIHGEPTYFQLKELKNEWFPLYPVGYEIMVKLILCSRLLGFITTLYMHSG